jgi:hypothetical protein
MLLMSLNGGTEAVGGAIFFWSSVNYTILAGSRKKRTAGHDSGKEKEDLKSIFAESVYPSAAFGGSSAAYTAEPGYPAENYIPDTEDNENKEVIKIQSAFDTEDAGNIEICKEVLSYYHEAAQSNSGKIINSLTGQGFNPKHICSAEALTEELFLLFIAVDSRYLYSFPERHIANGFYALTLKYFKLLYTQSYSTMKKIIADDVIGKYVSLYTAAVNSGISPDEIISGYLYERILSDNKRYYNIQPSQLAMLSSQVFPIFRGTFKAVINNHGFKGFNAEKAQQAESI